MPVYPPVTTYTLRADSVAVTRALALVTPVTTAFADYIAAHPTVPPGAAVDVAYIYYGAVTVGLNRWKTPTLWAPSYPFGYPDDVPNLNSFFPSLGTGDQNVSVDAANTDVARAQAIINAIPGAPTMVHVLGRALCTGLAYLSGSSTDQGPFT